MDRTSQSTSSGDCIRVGSGPRRDACGAEAQFCSSPTQPGALAGLLLTEVLQCLGQMATPPTPKEGYVMLRVIQRIWSAIRVHASAFVDGTDGVLKRAARNVRRAVIARLTCQRQPLSTRGPRRTPQGHRPLPSALDARRAGACSRPQPIGRVRCHSSIILPLTAIRMWDRMVVRRGAAETRGRSRTSIRNVGVSPDGGKTCRSDGGCFRPARIRSIDTGNCESAACA